MVSTNTIISMIKHGLSTGAFWRLSTCHSAINGRITLQQSLFYGNSGWPTTPHAKNIQKSSPCPELKKKILTIQENIDCFRKFQKRKRSSWTHYNDYWRLYSLYRLYLLHCDLVGLPLHDWSLLPGEVVAESLNALEKPTDQGDCWTLSSGSCGYVQCTIGADRSGPP